MGGAAIGLPLVGLAVGKLWCRLHVAQTADLALLLGVYPASAAARALGERYMAVARASQAACIRRIEQDDRIVTAVKKGCRSTMLAAVEQACRDDFRCGRTHCIDGWVMARTELDIAALATL